MHVAIFHPARLPIIGYGGTERIVVWLVRGLAELGIRVTLIAGTGSRIPQADVVEVDLRAANRNGFDLTPHLPLSADIAHYFVPVHRVPPMPHLWTMQGSARPGFNPGSRCVFVSHDHAKRHGSDVFVYNGVDLSEYIFQPKKHDNLLFLGRLHSVKGWRDAIRVARRSNRPVTIAGGWRPSFNRTVRFAGKVSGRKKAQLLAEASAVLMPIRWHEPFGIVIPEAWASGTPVIGRPLGSLPELVTGEVGGLAQSIDELAALVDHIGEWTPEACRRKVEQNFTHIAMAERYLEQYRHLLSKGALKAAQTKT